MRHGSLSSALTAVSFVLIGALDAHHGAAEVTFPGTAPGPAVAQLRDEQLSLGNNVVRMTWRITDARLRPVSIENRMTGTSLAIELEECFQLVLANTPSPGTRVVKASDMQIVGAPALEDIPVDSKSLRLADHQAGRAIVVRLASADADLAVTWKAVLRDGSNYLRQVISCQSREKALELSEVTVWDCTAPGAEVCGVVDGSPVVAGDFFFAAEHPTSKSSVVAVSGPADAPRFKCSYEVNGSLRAGVQRQFRALVGVVPPGQLRRGFLYYLERERAQPYRPLLQYNNGSEIGAEYWTLRTTGRPGEAAAFRRGQQQVWLSAIESFGRELVQQRHVVVDNFAHDHAWDDENLVWQFHEGYPNGFGPAQQMAEKYGSHLGVWFSPSGGYPATPFRLAAGATQGFETFRSGLTLAGPRYFARVHAACEQMIQQYGVGYFKFDGFGAGNNQPGAMDCASDVEALLELIELLRARKPDVFINPSTGSWPSPFWLLYCDSIWRQGADTNLQGKGSQRQQWISYRDGQILQGTLARGPLYPVNSLMIHGVFINHLPLQGNPYDPTTPRPTYDEAEITAEIRSFFATGVNLQELYVAPDLMTPRMWDVLAEAARWARDNAPVLEDTHALGGDPLAGQVYGWASWTPAKAIVSLRNPSDESTDFVLNLAQTLELPAGAPTAYRLASPWADEADKSALDVQAGTPLTLHLQPFQVVVFEATPVR
jgi:hypothetical protein